MINFREYLTEKNNMEGAVGTERKGIRHILNYVLPYMSAKQRAQFSERYAGTGLFDTSKIRAGHGEKHNPDENIHTHVLASAANGHEAGTPVRVTDVDVGNDGKISVQTANHGAMQLSKLAKPEDIRKPVITKGGFDVEGKLAKNLGSTPAGSTGTAWDYYYGKPGSEIKGKARKIEDEKPSFRGESKQNRAKMGESSIKWDPQSRQWGFTHKKLGEHYQNITVSKSADGTQLHAPMKILDYLNKYHEDGNVSKGFSTKAPTGTTRAYLNNLGVNSLHLHRTEAATKRKAAVDHGTTFTIGDDNELAGRTNLGHLSNEDIDRLDGNISFERGGHGSIKLTHKPNFGVFREYADRSRTTQGHADLTDEGHADIFKNRVAEHQAQSQKQGSTGTPAASKPTPMQIATQRQQQAPPTARAAPRDAFSGTSSPVASWRGEANPGPSNEMFGKSFHAKHELE